MIAVDTNILVYAIQPTSPFHSAALAQLEALERGSSQWGIPISCMAEFLSVVTNTAPLQKEALTIDEAVEEFDKFASRENARLLLPMEKFSETYSRLLRESRAISGQVFDVQIAAICIDHSVTRLITEDRRFPQFAELKLERLPATFERSLPVSRRNFERRTYRQYRNSSNLQVLSEMASARNNPPHG